MPELNEPIVTLERVKIHAIHATSLDLEVKIKVENLNSISATLREMPFTIFFNTGKNRKEIASGNTGRLEIAANSSTDIIIPVTSNDLMLVEALATILESGGIHLEIEGNAVIDHVLAGWTLPFTETINLTEKEVLDALGERSEGVPQ